MTMTTIRIKGMSCQHCVASVTKALEELPGVTDVRVDLQQATATFNGEAEEQKVKDAIAAIGFEVVSYTRS